MRHQFELGASCYSPSMFCFTKRAVGNSQATLCLFLHVQMPKCYHAAASMSLLPVHSAGFLAETSPTGSGCGNSCVGAVAAEDLLQMMSNAPVGKLGGMCHVSCALPGPSPRTVPVCCVSYILLLFRHFYFRSSCSVCSSFFPSLFCLFPFFLLQLLFVHVIISLQHVVSSHNCPPARHARANEPS